MNIKELSKEIYNNKSIDEIKKELKDWYGIEFDFKVTKKEYSKLLAEKIVLGN